MAESKSGVLEGRFQASLSLEATQIVTLLLHIPQSDQFGLQAKKKFAMPILYGVTDIIGTGAMKVHCHPDAVSTLKTQLPEAVASRLDGSDWEAAFDTQEVTQLIRARTMLDWETALKLSMLVSDLAVASRKRRALMVHESEIGNLRAAHDALAGSDLPAAMALASTLRAFVSVETPSVRIPIRRIELLEKLLNELIASSEFAEYGEERGSLANPDAWKRSDPLIRLRGARDRCLAVYQDLLAYPVVGVSLRMTGKVLGKLLEKIPILGSAFSAINFDEYQPMIYVLPREIPRLDTGSPGTGTVGS